MEIIIGIIVGLFVIGGVVYLVITNRKEREKNPVKETPTNPASDCCGAHEVCEYDQIKMDDSIIEYYDDEELDTYKNTNENNYSSNQIDQFREILYTLQVHEIRYWLLSIERRKIALPSILHDEARMLMAEE